jgi:hypothetical protein
VGHWRTLLNTASHSTVVDNPSFGLNTQICKQANTYESTWKTVQNSSFSYHGALFTSSQDGTDNKPCFCILHRKFSCENTAFIAGNCVLCCLNSGFPKNINRITRITYKTDKNAIFFCHFIGFVCDFIDFVFEFTVKTTEHTVASYKSHMKIFNWVPIGRGDGTSLCVCLSDSCYIENTNFWQTHNECVGIYRGLGILNPADCFPKRNIRDKPLTQLS